MGYFGPVFGSGLLIIMQISAHVNAAIKHKNWGLVCQVYIEISLQ